MIAYAYDAVGRRVAKTVGNTTERYVHDGDQVIEDIDGATHAPTRGRALCERGARLVHPNKGVKVAAVQRFSQH